jgi:glucose-6-phosphate 1-dehydrogenase
MAKQATLDVPVVGVASSKWSLAQLRKRAEDGIRTSGRIDDRLALRRLLSLLSYVEGDYKDPGTLKALEQAPHVLVSRGLSVRRRSIRARSVRSNV